MTICGRSATCGLWGSILEITVWERDPFDVQTTAAELERHGVEPVVLTQVAPETSLTDADPSVRAAGIDHLRYCIDVAVSLASISTLTK